MEKSRQKSCYSLKQAFREHRISNKQLSKFLGFSIASVNHWLNDYRPIPPNIERKMFQILADIRQQEKGGEDDNQR